MVTLGIRELRDNFSEYLHKVQEGETIRITKYGEEIARITPSKGELDEPLLKLLQKEQVHWNGDKPEGSLNPVTVEGTPVSEIVLEDRR